MAETKTIPLYTVYIVSGGTKYDVTPAVVTLDRSEDAGQIAQKVTIQLADVAVETTRLSELIKVRDRVFVYANDGTQTDEVFRGFLWTKSKTASLKGDELEIKCYDNLIYFQESEESEYFASGKSTKDIMASLCKKWGISLEYTYESITHSKLVLRGKLADIFTADILDLVKERTGKKYVISSIKDTMHVKSKGSNTTVYHFIEKQNVAKTHISTTMDGMITQVIILGKAEDDEREPIEATVSGKTDQYGTLQKIINRDSNTSLADAKKEANSIIEENGTPKEEGGLQAPDIPWIRCGDKVYVETRNMKGNYIVTSIDRSTENKSSNMTMTVEKEPTPAQNSSGGSGKGNVIYCAYASGKWWPDVTNYNNTNSDGYAGVTGSPIQGLRIEAAGRDVYYRVHTIGGSWLSEIKNRDGSGANSYAGIYGRNVDGVQIRTSKGTVKYRVHVLGGDWLAWVSCGAAYGTPTGDGYAGIYGKRIDKIQISLE